MIKHKWLYVMHIYSFVPFHVSEVIAIEYLPWSLLGTYKELSRLVCVTFCIFLCYGAFKLAVLFLEGEKTPRK